MTLLEMLSANPIQFKGCWATPANARIRDYMKRRGRDFSDNANVRRIPFLADREFDVQEFTITMKNGENASAEHVYVIAHDVYSAAGTLVAIAKGSEHVTAVGFPGTKMLGMGIDPYHFALPEQQADHLRGTGGRPLQLQKRGGYAPPRYRSRASDVGGRVFRLPISSRARRLPQLSGERGPLHAEDLRPDPGTRNRRKSELGTKPVPSDGYRIKNGTDAAVCPAGLRPAFVPALIFRRASRSSPCCRRTSRRCRSAARPSRNSRGCSPA